VSKSAGGGLFARATAELYAGLPEDFTRRRKELAAAARAAGDREAARLIGALRKPTRAAWVVNRLAHAEPGVAARLADLAAGLRAAEEAADGPRLRDLSSRRQSLIDSLAQRALAIAGLADPPPGLRAEVTATLAAALASQEVADRLGAGIMTHAESWSGFGLASQLTFSGDDLAATGEPAAADEPTATLAPPDTGEATVAPVPLPPQAPRGLPPQRARPSARLAASAGLAACPGRPASAEPAAASGSAMAPSTAPSTAPAKAGSAARRTVPPGPSVDDAEQSVATAAAVSAQAAAEEERLEVWVLDLERQLAKARAELANARLRARHTETAERKARQALARLQPPAGR
jgi:hypothetical protein